MEKIYREFEEKCVCGGGRLEKNGKTLERENVQLLQNQSRSTAERQEDLSPPKRGESEAEGCRACEDVETIAVTYATLCMCRRLQLNNMQGMARIPSA